MSLYHASHLSTYPFPLQTLMNVWMQNLIAPSNVSTVTAPSHVTALQDTHWLTIESLAKVQCLYVCNDSVVVLVSIKFTSGWELRECTESMLWFLFLLRCWWMCWGRSQLQWCVFEHPRRVPVCMSRRLPTRRRWSVMHWLAYASDREVLYCEDAHSLSVHRLWL